jgi:hypothetical protein
VKKKLLRAILLAVVAVALVVTPVLAVLYSAPYTITENASVSYPMLGVGTPSNNTWLANNGFITATGLDTRVETLGGLARPHMIADNATWVAVAVPADSQTNLFYTMGNSLLSVFRMIFGWGSYVTVADDDYLEPGANWTINSTGYIDMAQVGANLTYKLNAQKAYIGNNRIINTVNQTDYVKNSGNATDAAVAFWGVNWYAQTFTPYFDSTSINVTLVLGKVGAPAGNVTVSLRATDGAGDPTGGDLVFNDILCATVVGASGWYNFPLAYNMVEDTTYAIVVRAPAANIGNHITWWQWVADVEPSGQRSASGDSGVTWAPLAGDFGYRIEGNPIGVVVNGVSSGVRTISISGNDTNLFLDVDGTANVTTATNATVPGNANNWILNEGNGMPYVDNITMTVNGTQEVYFYPNTMILGTVLPDRAGGNHTGAISWGVNPFGVNTTLGSLIAETQPPIGLDVDEAPRDILPEVPVTDWFVEPSEGVLVTHPLRPFVTLLSDTTTLTERQAWVWLGVVFVLFVLVLTASNVRGHYLITGVATGVAIGALVAQTIFPFWTLIFVAVAILAGIVSERSPSL